MMEHDVFCANVYRLIAANSTLWLPWLTFLEAGFTESGRSVEEDSTKAGIVVML